MPVVSGSCCARTAGCPGTDRCGERQANKVRTVAADKEGNKKPGPCSKELVGVDEGRDAEEDDENNGSTNGGRVVV